jgi:hypothetical protein
MKPARVTKRVNAFIRGVTKHVLPGTTFKLGGVAYTKASLLAKLVLVQQANEELADARLVVSQKVQAREKAHAAIRPFLEALTFFFGSQYGVENPILGDFGLPYVKARRQLTVVQKAIATAEGVRTRRLRGSYTSKKQLAQITVAGQPGLSVVDPQGNVKELLPPAPPGKARPKRK